VSVVGQTSDTSTIAIMFRKRGQSTFEQRRQIQPGTDGGFATSYRADDDYRLYAATSRCDSAALLVQVRPILSGQTSATKGARVTLTARTIPGQRVSIYFRRGGDSSFSMRRAGTASNVGVYATNFVADADYFYYARSGPDGRASAVGTTRID
jgi:hypothetical protein